MSSTASNVLESPHHPSIVEWLKCPELAALSICLCAQPQYTQVQVKHVIQREFDMLFVYSGSQRVCQTTKVSEHAEFLRQLHVYGVEKADLEIVKASRAFKVEVLPLFNAD